MDNLTSLIKNILLKFNANHNEYGAVKMSDLNISDFMSGPQYSSTIKSCEDVCLNYNPHLTTNRSLNNLSQKRKVAPNRLSLNELPKIEHQFEVKERNHVPVMGKSALLVKSQKDRHESVIVHDIVVEKFNNILNYYYNRSLRRRNSRNRNSETMSCYSPCSLWDEDGDCFNFLRSTDDLNAESTFDEVTNRASSVSTGIEHDFSEYDASKFLQEALGDELKACLDDLTKNNPELEDSSIGTADLSILLSKATQNPINSSLMTTTCFDKEKINMQINIQNQIIQQTSKALNFCESTKEFTCSAEQVECERILLIATLRKELLMTTLNKREMNGRMVDEETTCYGSIELTNFHFPLKLDLTSDKEYISHYLLALQCNDVLYTSDLVDERQNSINFTQNYVFNHLESNFNIQLSVYCIRLRNNDKNFSHDAKFHLNRNTCPSPKKLFHRSPKYKVVKVAQATRPSLFLLHGQLGLNISNLCDDKLALQNVKDSSNLLGHFTVQTKVDVHLTQKINGFLTIAMQRDGYPIWNRRWCLLEGHYIKYWNYPIEENVVEPLNVINLKDCSICEVTAVDRSVCARARTLLLPIHKDNYFLSADALNEFNEWKLKINFVLDSLNKWNCMHF